VRILPNTVSPSKQFAFGWRMRDDKQMPAKGPNSTDGLENVLVRLSDGAVLARLAGTYWTLGDSRANQLDTNVTWSIDERAVVETAIGRWLTYAQTYVTLADGKAMTVDILVLFEPLIRARMAKEFRDDYRLRVRSDKPATFEQSGRLRVAHGDA
jgi:phosphatidylserine/phosphatidylglycerophosphate/cardiolipin synthase-like enzyme